MSLKISSELQGIFSKLSYKFLLAYQQFSNITLQNETKSTVNCSVSKLYSIYFMVITHLIARLMIVGPKAVVYSGHIICNDNIITVCLSTYTFAGYQCCR